MSNAYDHFGVPTIINGASYSTRVGGSCPAEPVLQAMLEANRAFVEIDDLQAAASRVIARHTGAAAGIVTCGAAAGLTLAAAACVTGDDTTLMDRLPDTRGCARDEIIYPLVGRYEYEHAIRASGAKLIALDYSEANVLSHIEAAITPRTAAIGFAWQQVGEHPTIEALAALAHRHGLPLIVDGAKALPPVENLRGFIARGADLVAFSGGKHIQGPQASGILCGRADLVHAAWMQMVDMDVRSNTWSLHQTVARERVPTPPRHGIGRSMKVGKEAIIGLMTALELYAGRDFAAETAAWRAWADELTRGLGSVPGVRAESLFPAPNGQPFAVVRLQLEGTSLTMTDLIWRLRDHRPKIILTEDEDDASVSYIYTTCLQAGEPAQIVAAFAHILRESN